MASQVTNYQCPACSAPLHYEAATGYLLCDFCDSTYGIAEIERLYAEKEAQAAEALAVAEAKHKQQQAQADAQLDTEAEASAEHTQEASSAWANATAGDEWDLGSAGLNVYNCPSCGAELICDETTAATACPYCDNPTIIPGKLHGTLKPEYVLPFKLKKEDAIAALKRHYEGRPFLPKVFKDENHLQEIKGIYVPFWLFDGEARGSANYEATNVRSYIVGENQVTETDHYSVHREGFVAFEKIPVDASSKMDNDYMDSIEPFDYSEIQPFSTAYLVGYFADRYDESIEECGSRADNRAAATLVSSLRDTVHGYAAVFDRGSHVMLNRSAVRYALLPVWLLNTRWNGEVYQFAMNGQTGKFVGHLPTDNGKRLRTFLGVYAIVLLITALVVLFPLGLIDLLGM